MAIISLYNIATSPVLALDMNRIDISTWVDGGFDSLQYLPRPYRYWVAHYSSGELSATEFYGYDIEISELGPVNGDVWGLGHFGPGFQLNIWYFNMVGIADLLDLISSDNREAFWTLILNGNDDISGTVLNDRVFGWAGDDSITTADGDDTIRGGEGNDSISGGDGADIINGDAGADRISGGAGRDRLTGGLGADSFVFSAPAGGANRDRITDFNPEKDFIVLSRSRFSLNGSNGEGLQEANFHYGASATEATHRIMYDPVTGNLILDRDGTGPLSSSVFAVMDAGLVLDASVFVLTE